MQKIAQLEESIAVSQAALRKAIAESSTDEERLSYGLRLVMEPAWARWIKESGAKPSQIARAITELAASLIAETAKNIARPGEAEILAKTMGENIAHQAAYYVSDEVSSLADVPAFRRRDS